MSDMFFLKKKTSEEQVDDVLHEIKPIYNRMSVWVCPLRPELQTLLGMADRGISFTV